MTTGTHHVVGLCKIEENGSGECYPCNSKTEMAQATLVAEKKGNPITVWLYQTVKGYHLLGDRNHINGKPHDLPKLVDCPICEGHGCIVCNYSGFTRKNHWLKWQPWQLDNIHADAIIRERPDNYNPD